MEGNEEDWSGAPRRSTRSVVLQKKISETSQTSPATKRRRTESLPQPKESDEESENEAEASQPLPEDPQELIKSSWKVIRIVQFFKLFKHVLDLKVSIDEVENEFLVNAPHLPLIPQMALALVKLHYRAATPTTWEKNARHLVNKGSPNLFPDNQTFFELPLLSRIEVLFKLTDIIFELHTDDFRENLEDPALYKVEPLGKDSQGRTYWYFKGTRLYRETPFRKPKNEDPQSWEVICESAAEWEGIQQEFASSKVKAEKELHQVLKDLIPRVLGKLKEKERQEKRKAYFNSVPKKTSSRLIEKQEMEERARREAAEQKLRREKELQEQMEEQKRLQEEKKRQELEMRKQELGRKRQEAEANALMNQRLVTAAKSFEAEMNEWIAQQTSKVKLDRVTKEKFPADWHPIIFSIKTSTKIIPLHPKLTPMSPPPVRSACKGLVELLKSDENSWPFLKPVDPVALGILDYFDVIKQPMDLSTVLNKLLLNEEYQWVEQFQKDVLLIFANCHKYNAPGSDITVAARSLETKFHKYFRKIDFASLLSPTEKAAYDEAFAKFQAEHPTDPFLVQLASAKQAQSEEEGAAGGSQNKHHTPQKKKASLTPEADLKTPSQLHSEKKADNTKDTQQKPEGSITSTPIAMPPITTPMQLSQPTFQPPLPPVWSSVSRPPTSPLLSRILNEPSNVGQILPQPTPFPGGSQQQQPSWVFFPQGAPSNQLPSMSPPFSLTSAASLPVTLIPDPRLQLPPFSFSQPVQPNGYPPALSSILGGPSAIGNPSPPQPLFFPPGQPQQPPPPSRFDLPLDHVKNTQNGEKQ